MYGMAVSLISPRSESICSWWKLFFAAVNSTGKKIVISSGRVVLHLSMRNPDTEPRHINTVMVALQDNICIILTLANESPPSRPLFLLSYNKATQG